MNMFLFMLMKKEAGPSASYRKLKKMTNWKIRPTLKPLHKMYMNVHVLVDADENGDWTKRLI